VQLASAERIAQATQHAKLLEIFTAQIVSPSAAARANAVRLLRAVDPELGAKLAEGVAADESQPAAVRQEAKMVFQGLKKSPSSLFTSVPDSCRSAPTATRFNGQLDQDQANKECERAASRGGPKLSDGTWTWKPKFNGIELTCTCISRGGNDDSSK
jgi:hypothetical protein